MSFLLLNLRQNQKIGKNQTEHVLTKNFKFKNLRNAILKNKISSFRFCLFQKICGEYFGRIVE